MTARYRVAIIGLGNIAIGLAGERKRPGLPTHAQAFDAHPACELVAGCDPDARAQRAFAKRYPRAKIFTDVKSMLDTIAPDIISLASPHKLHTQHLLTALAAKPRAILCEKPLCTTPRELATLTRALARAKIPIAMNCTRRYDPMHQKIARALQRKRYGALQHITIHASGSLFGTATHVLDEIATFAGPLTDITALPPYNTDLTHGGNFVAQTAQKITIAYHTIPQTNYLLYEFECYTERARIQITTSGLLATLAQSAPHPCFTQHRALTKMSSPFGEGAPGNIAPVVTDLIRAIRTHAQPLCGPREAIAMMRALFAYQRSAKRHGATTKISNEGV